MSGRIRRFDTLGIAREDDATKGTAVALSTGHCFGVTSGILRPVVEMTPNPANFGVNHGTSEHFVTHKHSELVFTAPVKLEWLGHFLTGIFGTVASATVTGAQEHTITALGASASLPAYTIFIIDGIATKRCTYGTVKRVTLTCESNGLLMATVEMVGQVFEGGSGSASFAEDHHMQGSFLAVKQAAAITNLSGSSDIGFHHISVTFEREIFAKQVFGSLEPTHFIGGPLKITGELGLLYEAVTQRDLFEAGAEAGKAYSFDWNDSATAIGSNTPELFITLAKGHITNYQRPEGIDEEDVETLSLEFDYDLTESTPQVGNIVLTNEESTTAYTEPA